MRCRGAAACCACVCPPPRHEIKALRSCAAVKSESAHFEPRQSAEQRVEDAAERHADAIVGVAVVAYGQCGGGQLGDRTEERGRTQQGDIGPAQQQQQRAAAPRSAAAALTAALLARGNLSRASDRHGGTPYVTKKQSLTRRCHTWSLAEVGGGGRESCLAARTGLMAPLAELLIVALAQRQVSNTSRFNQGY